MGEGFGDGDGDGVCIECQMDGRAKGYMRAFSLIVF